MLETIIKGNSATLEINNILLKGLNTNEFKFYPEKNIILFSNTEDEENVTTRLYFYDLLKHLTVKDIPNNVHFNIIPIRINEPNPSPTDKIPYPFDNITFGKTNDTFFVRFDAIINPHETIGDEWKSKWAPKFYFDRLKKITISENVKIFEETELSDQMYIQFDFDKSETVQKLVDQAIQEINILLNKIESGLSGLTDFFNAIEIWHKNTNNKNEKFWQKTFKDNAWLLSLCFNAPLMLFEKEAFLGGKNISNTNGNIVDFIFKNNLTHNLTLIEIKSPATHLIGSKYRNTYSISKEVIGSIIQVLNYKEQLQKDFFSIHSNSSQTFEVINPKLLLIIGSLKDLDRDKKKAFELFRAELKSIEIITFDELFEKVFMQLRLMGEQNSIPSNITS